MANPFAGEVRLNVNGQDHHCKLTLGALAELETAMQSDCLMDLIARFEGQSFTATDILNVAHAGLRGGGWAGSKSDLMVADFGGGLVGVAQAAAQMLTLAFSVPDVD